MAEKTIEELNEERKRNSGPVSGYSTGQIPGVGIYRPDTGQQVATTGQSVSYAPPKANDQEARIGDYVMQGGTPVVVPNSRTDIEQRYKVVIGGNPKSITRVSSIAGGAAAGAVAGSAAGAVAGATTGSAAGAVAGPVGAIVGSAIGIVAGALNALTESQKNAIDAWQDQKVDVESAVDFYRDDAGKLRAKIDYEEAEKGGVLSGQGVKDIQNIQTTVDLGDDGRLKVNTSPGFAATNLYQYLLGDISARYAGLSKDDAEYDKKIKEIRDLITGWANRYRYEMGSYADYRQRFQGADDQAITAGYTTELAGYLKPDEMKDYKMAVISEGGEVTQQSAEELFNSVYDMNKDQRNEFIGKLTDIAYGDDEEYSDSDRAIAYGELQALRAVDTNVKKYENDKYEGMLDADFSVSLIANFRPLGLDSGDVIKFVSGGNLMSGRQEYLDQNELATTIGAVAGPLAGAGALRGATQGLEKVLKMAPGTAQLFRASLQGTEGGAIAFFAQNTGNTAAVAKAVSASFAFEVIKDSIFDAALAGTKALVSKEDFLPTFGEDLARDLVIDLAFQYYDTVKFAKTTMDSKVWVYRGEDGRIETLKSDGRPIVAESGETLRPVAEVNVSTTSSGKTVGIETDAAGSTLMVDGEVVRVNKIDEAPAFRDGVIDVESDTDVPGSADEVVSNALRKAGLPDDTQVFAISARDAASAEAAGKVASWDTSKVGLVTNKHIFTRNAGLDALNNLAFAKDADRTAWQRATETFASNLKLAENMKTDIQNGRWIKSTATTWNNYVMKQGEFQTTFGKMKKTDLYYLNAKEAIERARLAESEKIEGDVRDYEKEALDKYGKYLDLPADRAKALDNFQDARKAYLTDFNRSVNRSGWVDRDKLNAATESSLQTKVGWVPLWGKNEDYNGLLDSFYGIEQIRNPIKSWVREGDLVDIEDYESPLIADERYTQLQATQMALNYRNLTAAQRAASAGLLVDNSPSPETVRKKKLASIKNKDALKKKLDDMIADTEKKVEEVSLTAAEYADMMTNLYEKYKIDSAIEKATKMPKEITRETWNEAWKDMGREERSMLRDELAKTAQQTGYGVSDTRARLNSMVPGFDVLDWSLLGRDHTNGLVPGGLYSGRQNEVKAYIMDLDDVMKLTGLDSLPDQGAEIDKLFGDKITLDINTERGNAVLPLHLRGGGDGPDFWLKSRWGHSKDTAANWAHYLSSLKRGGVARVPVAIEDGAGGIIGSIAENVEKKLGKTPQDITSDLQQAFVEYGRIPFYRGQRGLGQFNMNDLSTTTQVGDAYWIAPNSSYTDSYGKDKIMGTIPVKYFMSDKEKNDLVLKLEKRNWELFDKGYDNLSKKEKKEYDKIIEAIEPRLYKGGVLDSRYREGSRPEILSYRALAEYAKKPVIDISDDNFADGTAFFYYKGVDPKFDEEVGQQLATQALFDRQHPQWDGDSIAQRMDAFYDGMSLDEMIDFVTTGEGWGEDWDMALGDFENGEVSSSELTEDFQERVSRVAKKHPGIAKVMIETWDNNTIKDLRDMKFRYWNPATGYPTIDDQTAGAFLDDMGESRPRAEEEPAAEGQLSFYDVIRPTAENIPISYQVAQPRSVSYDDYEVWKAADPDAEAKFLAAIRKSRTDTLVNRASQMLRASNNYLRSLGISTDVQDYVRTSLRPDLEAAIQVGDKSLAATRIGQAQLDVTPFVDPDYLKKSQLDATAERWREWAEKHVKGGRANTKQLKTFAESNMLELPDRKGPLAGKIKHALWEKVQANKILPNIEGLDTATISPDMDKQAFYEMLDETPLFQSAVRDKKELVDLVSAEINGETTDAYKMGVSKSAAGMGGKFPIPYYVHGRPYTRFMMYDNEAKYRLADEVSHELNDKELIAKHGLFSRLATGVSNTFMNLTTALDPSRVGPNVARDTVRGEVMSGSESFLNAGRTFKSVVSMGNYTKAQAKKLNQAIDLATKKAANDTYNSQFKNPKNIQTQLAEEYLNKSGAGPLRKFTYRFAHDKASILAAPADFFESFTRKRLSKSAAAVALYRAQKEGKSFDAQMEDMLAAADFAGREYTANFLRKGETIGRVAKYVPYLGSAYASVDSLKRAYINNPKGVTHNFAAFLFAYLVLLADTLANEESRKQYHRLTEYDRAHSIVISLGDNSILTIPLDEQLASFAYPYRRILETLNGTDPVSFFEFVWGTLTEPLPMDLSGFSEGGYFNLQRGLEKFVEQHAPRALTSALEVATGYDLYYGSSNAVTQEYLQDAGLYAPTPGDYTTAGKNSATLRAVADATGIPQWQLQSVVSNFGGNVGQYVLNTIDKLAGASKDAQGGKDFADAVFKSFVATDSDNAASQFYNGIQKLQEDKQSLLQKIYSYNEDAKTATGQALVDIQQKVEKAKQDYATKVSDFVSQYLNAYEITGGLSKAQANRIYYLFVLGDNDTPYEAGSVAEYYGNLASQQMGKEANRLSAPILDRYYDQSKTGVYRDADGEWRVYAPYGQQSYLDTFYGQGTRYEVDLRNAIEGKNNSLKAAKTATDAKRKAAYQSKDWDAYNQAGADFDKLLIDAIAPIVNQYGAQNVLTNSTALDYLENWVYVPDTFIRTKYNKYVSLAHDAKAADAFKKPYLKYLFGLDTGATNYREIELENNKAGEFIK